MRLFLLTAVLMLAAGDALAEALRIAPESKEYCSELLTRIALLPHPLPEPSRSLAREGQDLCEQGQIRSGVSKLRRALRAAQPNMP